MECRRLAPEEYHRFDVLVNESRWGNVLQSTAWGKLKTHTGWSREVFAVIDENKIQTGALVLIRDIPGIGSPVMYSPRGPVAAPGDDQQLGELTRGIREFGKDIGAVFWKIDPPWKLDSPGTKTLDSLDFNQLGLGDNFDGLQPRFVMRLPVNEGTYEELLMEMHSKTRYNIRLADRRGVEVRAGSEEDIEVFYRLLETTSRRNEFGIREQSYFENLCKDVLQTGWGKIFMAEYEGEAIAGTIGLINSHMAWYVYGASANKHRDVMPNYALQWEMISWAKEHGCSRYDFRGVSGDLDPDNPLYGLYRFKKGFGAELVELIGEYDLVLRPMIYRIYRSAEPVYRKLQDILGELTEGSG